MGEKKRETSRHPNQDKWDKQWSRTLAANQSTDQLRTNLERTQQAISGEAPNGRDAAFNEIHSQTLRAKLGERGIATEIYRPDAS
jgi:hypothetical protein